jgi:hypothetical protein
MTHKKRFPGRAHGSLLLAVVLSLIVPASAEWKEKVLYSFQGGTSDGSGPAGGVVLDPQGNLYGATAGGGPASCGPIGGECGTVFQLTPPAQEGGPWTETLIYQFQGKGSNDASVPSGGLIRDAAGNLYGVTAYGGTGDCLLLGVPAGCGTVYEISRPKQKGGPWTETILYSFPTAKQGYLPNGNLVFDRAGNLYGATVFGGTKGKTCDKFYGGQCGVIFELSPSKQKGGQWTEKLLYEFAGVEAGHNFGDGASPNGGLVVDSKGSVYSTTYYGGNNVKGECQGGTAGTGCGIVFELTPPTQKGGKWTKKVLHQFDGHDGSNSSAGVVFDGNGNLYGTTTGGPGPYGLVFELRRPSRAAGSWTESVLHAFTGGNDGEEPMAAIVFDSVGRLYGTALGGGTHRGVVFRLVPPKRGNSWAFSLLDNLQGAPDADHPTANLVFDSSGNLYSTSEWGGTSQSCQGGCGTVFEVSP